MCEISEKLEKAKEYICKRAGIKPAVGIVLGSGLGNFAERAEIVSEIPYEDIPCFPRSTVEGHKGRFVFGKIGNTPVVIMQGRVHYYEGYPMEDVIMPARIMGLLGIKTLLLTNAAGGVNKGFSAGDLMLIKDHISCFVPNPLIGKNLSELGTRFPDMSEVYDRELSGRIKACAESLGTELKEGIYCQLTGPSYETPAEIKMLSVLGADAVGMSTAVEAIAARHMGVRVCGISLITNMAAGISEVPLSHEEVKEAADKAEVKFGALVERFIAGLSE
ncbi:purine nucleoside phosphorylase [Ruminococcus albus SY3]|uniref:Purine nucleoside phosphorylase n=1 Tax=Ruminococcus albus SY3 TaxID=1341156 RepID=A0A011WUR9_RUMAL|nr:purine-nucleoside phosphorylase [Ruminococcus albus]EXM40770.1 purine nucleoside phosphorylase [Ruminococcus albus SY3]